MCEAFNEGFAAGLSAGGDTAAPACGQSLEEITVKRDALHLVVSVLAAKCNVASDALIGMLNQAEEELRAKRWLS